MDSAGTASVDGAHAKNEEARLMGMIRQAHTKALQMTLEGLGPEVFHKYVRQIEGKVDADASALAARVAVKVVERSEEGFRQLCDRMAVNEKLLALEQAVKEKGGEGEVEPATGGDELTGEPLSPLPGGRLPAELIRESVMRLKSAERAKLQAQVEETEAGTNVEAAKVAELESALANRLAEVTAIQQALTEVRVALALADLRDGGQSTLLLCPVGQLNEMANSVGGMTGKQALFF